MKEKGLCRFNIAFIVIAILSFVSSILLECLRCRIFLNVPFRLWVWIHIVICLLCMVAVIYHIYLHRDSVKQSVSRQDQINTASAKRLAWLWLVTLLSGIVATILFWKGVGHNPIGGVHGKIGLIAIVFMFFHIRKQRQLFVRRQYEDSFSLVIDQEKCIGCGKCVKKCPAHVFFKEEDKVIVKNVPLCHQCMRCITGCPKGAISFGCS